MITRYITRANELEENPQGSMVCLPELAVFLEKQLNSVGTTPGARVAYEKVRKELGL